MAEDESVRLIAELSKIASGLIAEAGTHLVFAKDDHPQIKVVTTHLSGILVKWQAHDKIVRETLSSLLRLARSQCSHVGAQRGHNERDGSWMNACPWCGETK